MAASYFPRSDAGLLVWLGNLQATLPTQAKALGLTPADTKDALDGAKLLATSRSSGPNQPWSGPNQPCVGPNQPWS